MGTFLVVFGLFAVCFGLQNLLPRLRTRAMRSLALRRGFHYIGGPLPTSFRMTCDPAAGLRFASDVIEGQTNGVRILIFDCAIGVGRGQACTFIATQTNQNPFGRVSWGEKIVQSCGWSALYRLRPLFPGSAPWSMSIQRIEEHLDGLRIWEQAH